MWTNKEEEVGEGREEGEASEVSNSVIRILFLYMWTNKEVGEGREEGEASEVSNSVIRILFLYTVKKSLFRLKVYLTFVENH